MRMISLAATFAIAAAFLSQPARSETTDPLKPAAIETREVPSVPQEIANRLQQYQSTRAAGFASWSPDGQGMLVRTRFGNSLQLHRVYTPGGRREQITFFEEPVDGAFLPRAKDGAILITQSAAAMKTRRCICSIGRISSIRC